MKSFLQFSFILLVFIIGCKNEEDKPLPNKKPKTFFWIYPDSTTREGNSRQRIHWWGEDGDGVIRGYLFALGKFLDSAGHLPSPDTIGWRFTIKTDSIVAFPLLTKRDTFHIAIRALDNTFAIPVPQSKTDTPFFSNALVRFSPTPYWDKNENGTFDGNDIYLSGIGNAVDPLGATQPMPLKNQPPKIFFAVDPNTQAETFRQPETTFTAVTFAWYGTDADGDQTISKFVVGLNDTINSSNKISLPGTVKLISLVVPRSVSDTATGIVNADVYTGTYITPPVKVGTIGGLKLNDLNKFYIQAIDVAGDSSHYIGMPQGNGKWFVKKPQGKLLIVSDYIVSDSVTALSFYRSMFPQVLGGQFAQHEVLNVARGLSAQDKKDSKISKNVPPFYDPAMIFTLHLFDVVFWYTDPYPSLNVAQIPLYEYIHNSRHQGKVIYSTMFETSIDPSGALKDFAPIDSISQVDLVTPSRLLPAQGDTRLLGGSYVFADSSDPDIFPNLQFNTNVSTHALYMRPVYKRPDSRYIYHVQEDTRIPTRYVYGVTLNEFRSVSANGSHAWACGVNGIIYHTSNDGQDWRAQTDGNNDTLNSIQMLDAGNGWTVGNVGTILQTTDGGESWNNRSLVTFVHLNNVHFLSPTHGAIVGNLGLVIRTTDGGQNWQSQTSGTGRTLNAVRFSTTEIGITVGDSGLILTTTNGGTTWNPIQAISLKDLNSVSFTDSYNAIIVGDRGQLVRLSSVDNGATWSKTEVTLGTSSDFRSLYYFDNSNIWASGTTGTVFKSNNGGTNWVVVPTGVTQNLNGISFSTTNKGWCVGSFGTIINTADGGSTWKTQPRGNIDVGVIDGARSFVFLGLPLHRLNGANTMKDFLEHVLFEEFGLR
ncbi:MAG: hypothetical protein HYZ34_14505 [Ignavibacteriae bacterium]|nr:hypothetical protein [Ignavibacteriota bacterium]